MKGQSKKRRAKTTNIPGLYKMEPSRVFKKGGWKARYRDNANGTRERTFASKQEALDFLTAVRADKRRGEFQDPRLARTPFGIVAERWYKTTGDLRPKTRAGYRTILDAHLLQAFEDRAVSRIAPSDIKAMLTGSGSAVGTQRNVLRVLSPIMNLAVDDGMIRNNPCARVKLAPSPQTEMHFLTAEEVRALAEEVGHPYDTLVYFAAYTGLRAGEIAALRVKHLNLMRGRVTVAESVSDVNGKLHTGPPKNGRTRTVALPRFLVELLVAPTAGKGPEDFVFTGTRSRQLRHRNFYARHFKPAVRRALPEHLHGLRFHDLRHTAASLLIAQGTHPKAVANRLGHSSIAITMDRYGHLYPDHEEAIVAALDRTYSGTVVAGGKVVALSAQRRSAARPVPSGAHSVAAPHRARVYASSLGEQDRLGTHMIG